MSLIRPVAAGDLDAVATLYQEIFLRGHTPPSAELKAVLDGFYLRGPCVDPGIPSLVHVDAEGRVSGFVGVSVVPISFGGRRLRAAFCGALMVRNPEAEPTAGARLVKAFLAGEQDLSLSETANVTSLDMSRALKGTAFPDYSLEWMRVLRPLSFACDTALSRHPLRRFVRPIAQGLDRLQAKFKPMAFGGKSQTDAAQARNAAMVREISVDEFADVLEPLTRHLAFKPDWNAEQLRHVIGEAFQKPRYGAPVAAIVGPAGSPPLGAFLYHLRPSGVARVLQILSLPGREEKVLDCLLADAARRGAAGLRGRTQPALLQAMLGKGIFFANASSMVVFSRDEQILDCFRRGDALATGIGGESWGRHIGGEFR